MSASRLSAPPFETPTRPPAHYQASSDTPHKQNMASTNAFIYGTREQQKKAVRDDLGPVPEVTVDFMLKYIIPDSSVDVDSTLALLEKQKLWSKENGWSAFNGKSPKELAQPTDGEKKRKETEVFSVLQHVYANIISNTIFADRSERKPTLVFRQLPDSAPLSDTKVRTRPDCCGEFTRDNKLHTKNFDKVRSSSYVPDADGNKAKKKRAKANWQQHWFDISYIEEYKLDDSIDDLNDNILKILWSLHHMMHVDHRRRFAFGLTIENETSRIWFCCRQTVLVSEPFNFNKDGTQLIHLISSLAYATPVQLGYDPTMKLMWPEGSDRWQYEIEVSSKTGNTQRYQTSKVISDTSNNIRGRATRVYLVRPVDAKAKGLPDTDFILKDSWIDVNRAKEGDTLATILKDASDNEKKLFLTVLTHGIVQINGKDDSTHDLILKRQDITVIPRENTNERIEEEPQSKSAQEAKSEPESKDEDHRAILRLQAALRRAVIEPSLIAYMAHADDEQKPTEAHPSNSCRLFDLCHEPDIFTETQPAASTSQTGSAILFSSDALPHHNPRQLAKQIVYSPKHHYRIVFEEVGQSLMSLAESNHATFAIVSRVMCDITLALQFMTKKGYVHRDVSAGNIIFYRGGAKLADLEFAKEYGAGQSAYIRTGTYSFMATEVAKGEYWFSTTLTPFAHNPVHDLESLWWVGVWCAIWHHPSADHSHYKGKLLVGDVKKQEKLGKMLFPTYFNPIDNIRSNELHHKNVSHFQMHTHQRHSLSAKLLFINLDHFRRLLVAAYLKISRESSVNAAYFTEVLKLTSEDDTAPIYDHIFATFSDYDASDEYTILPLQSVINELNSKNKSKQIDFRPRIRGRAFLNRDCKKGQNFDT